MTLPTLTKTYAPKLVYRTYFKARMIFYLIVTWKKFLCHKKIYMHHYLR